MSNAMEHLEYGVESFRRGILPEAIFWLEKAVEKDINLAKAHIYLGRCYAIKFLLNEAIKHFEIAYQLNKEETELQYWLKVIQNRKYMIVEHPDLFRRTFWIDRNDLDGHYALGLALVRNHINSEAIEEMNVVLKTTPQNAFVQILIGIAYSEQHEYDKAIDAYTKAIRIQPNLAMASHNIGIFYQKKREWDKVFEIYDKSIIIQPNYVDVYSNLGFVCIQMKEFDRAVDAYTKSITIQPALAKLYHNLGISYQEKRELDKAFEAYNKAITIQPDHANACNNLGFACIQMREFDKAVDAYTKSITIQPDLAMLYHNLGNFYQKNGELDKAFEAYNKAITIQSDLYITHSSLWHIYQRNGELDKAFEVYSKAITTQYGLYFTFKHGGQLSDEFFEIYNRLGLIHLLKGNFDKAIENYKKAILMKPDNANFHNDLAVCDTQLFEEAVACWQGALQLNKLHISEQLNKLHISEQLNKLHISATINYIDQIGKSNKAFDMLTEWSQQPLEYLKLLEGDHDQIDSLDVFSSSKERRQLLDESLDVYNKALDSLEHIYYSTKIAIYWINIKLYINGIYPSIKDTVKLSKYFVNNPGYFLFASLAGLFIYFIQMLREMCIQDMNFAKSCCESILASQKSSKNAENAKLKYKEITQLKHLSEKYDHLDSHWIFFNDGIYRNVEDLVVETSFSRLPKKLLDSVSILVEKLLDDIANQRFLYLSLEPDTLVKLNRNLIQIFEQELEKLGGISEDILKAVYGCAINIIYQNCLIKQENHGKLTFLRHQLIIEYSDILSAIKDSISPSVEPPVDLEAFIDESLSSIREIVAELLQLIQQPIEFEIRTAFDSIGNRIGERKLHYGKNDEFKSITVYGIRPIVITIFSNILNNAYDNFERHKQKDGRIDAHICGKNSNFVSVNFYDNGTGIPQHVIEAVMSGLNSVPSEKCDLSHGSGLVIVRDLLQSIDGDLIIERLPKRGTRVEVIIPRKFGVAHSPEKSEEEFTVLLEEALYFY